MTTTKPFWHRARLPLAISLASTLSAPAFALNFNIGEIEAQFDSSLSIGASWSTAKPNQDLIGANNGGRGLSQTSDDSRMNFDRGDAFSQIFKGVHDLELRYGDMGAFLRGKYWYDHELENGDHWKEIDNKGRERLAKSSGAALLDAFVYYNYNIADLPGTVRLGKQVVSWGESTFIQGGINSINPADVSALRRPGAELKEAFIPVNMFYVGQSLTDNLSVEAFYQLEWDPTVVENCGTFFSQPDVVAPGCDSNLAVLSPDLAAAYQVALGNLQNPANPGSPAGAAALVGAYGFDADREGVKVRRGTDVSPKDDGQWGIAFRYMFEPLDTEFGAYFMNYHSRMPIFSGRAGSAQAYQAAQAAGQSLGLAAAGLSWADFGNLVSAACNMNPQCATPQGQQQVGAQVFNNILESDPSGALATAVTGIGAGVAAGAGEYFIEYPEDIRLYGLSFSTTLPTGTAWQGEISYRPNAPVQLNTTDVLYSALTTLDPNVSLLTAAPGSTKHGFERKEITQVQTTFTHFVDQVMGASRMTLVGEIGWTHVGGLEDPSVKRYGRDPIFGPGPLPNGRCETLNASTLGSPTAKNVSRYCENDGFTTSNSWGYRLRAAWDYPNAFLGVNLQPNLAWSHDVEGYSPGPGGNFEEGRKAISVGLNADYQNTYTMNLSYTDFFDGKYSTQEDRDFVALSFGVNF